MNRNYKKFITAGAILVVFIFTLPLFWPVNPDVYYSNLNWLVPLTIAVFIAPLVPFILSNWDIHFHFKAREDTLIVTISNHGTTSFGFNRIQFSSGKRFKLIGKRKSYPEGGIYAECVELHGSDTPSQILHEHTGYVLKRGLPITLTIRSHQAALYLNEFKNGKIYLSLYYEGSNQRVFSEPIPSDIVMAIKNYKRP